MSPQDYHWVIETIKASVKQLVEAFNAAMLHERSKRKELEARVDRLEREVYVPASVPDAFIGAFKGDDEANNFGFELGGK